MGRLITQTESNGIEKSHTYDLAGNRKSFTLKQNGAVKSTVTYDYDKLSRLTKVYDSGVLIATYTYDVNGNRESLTYQNGVTTTYTYNDANMVTGLTNKKSNYILSSYAYTYYLDGNQAAKTENTGKKTDYVYDGLGRLINEAESGIGNTIARIYSYDKAGNRATKITKEGTKTYTTTYTYDANNRLLTDKADKGFSVETNEYRYDANGNQVSREWEKIEPLSDKQGFIGFVTNENANENATYETREYNCFNQLVGVQGDLTNTLYSYKPDGLRLSKIVSGKKTTHIWDGGNIVSELNAQNQVTDRYIRGINVTVHTP